MTLGTRTGVPSAYQHLGPVGRTARSTTTIGLEISRLAGAAPGPVTLVRLAILLVRAVRLIRQ